MNLGLVDLFHVIITLALLLSAAHLGGYVAARLRIPPMVGELAGGLLMGQTVLKRLWPDAHAWLLPALPATGGTVPPVLTVLGFCSTIGLLLLMFIGGLQLRRLLTRDDTASVGWVAATGVIVPVVAGLLLFEVVDFSGYAGTAGHLGALKIVLLIELAITSIPVIARIFLDLGLMHSRLARIVLSVAVIEDVLLYVALSIALGMVQAKSGGDASVLTWLGVGPDEPAFVVWHIAASLLLLGVAAWGFGPVHAPGGEACARFNFIARRSPLAWLLTSVLAITGVAMLLGLAPMFGALVAGIVASRNTHPEVVKAQQQVESVGLGFFIPLYFALIGASLDLVRDLDVRLTLGILVFGSVVKYGGALLGGWLAREPLPMANALAISVNARGGPGLLVAASAFAAGIVNPAAYTSLVMLSVVTSVGAGLFLAHLLRTRPAVAELIVREEAADGTAAGDGFGLLRRPH
ncbi:cation:proton antiporter [Methyloversatilis universalis]|uniref:cation:proton antiporter n=1 Tax=Methyloversatilis universalis TaxID=378211 RepID=UPI00036D0B94|nr:cation:proton antiporter [Methyloversatilis universalis]